MGQDRTTKIHPRPISSSRQEKPTWNATSRSANDIPNPYKEVPPCKND